MITEYKFITIFPKGPALGRPEKNRYDVINRKCGFILGEILWYASWRQYVFCPSEETVFSVDCMADIIHFIGQLKGETKWA